MTAELLTDEKVNRDSGASRTVLTSAEVACLHWFHTYLRKGMGEGRSGQDAYICLSEGIHSAQELLMESRQPSLQ